jgi:hypothetical protein
VPLIVPEKFLDYTELTNINYVMYGRFVLTSKYLNSFPLENNRITTGYSEDNLQVLNEKQNKAMC